jgi:hypothetical protein
MAEEGIENPRTGEQDGEPQAGEEAKASGSKRNDPDRFDYNKLIRTLKGVTKDQDKTGGPQVKATAQKPRKKAACPQERREQ